MLRATLAALVAAPACFSFAVVSFAEPRVGLTPTVSEPARRYDDSRQTRVPFALAPPNTTLLFASTFDVGATCSTNGWTVVDLTAQIGDFWHVENYAGLPFGPIAGAQSLWCGARPQATGPLCSYVALPGYGNAWDQAWCTTSCIPITGNLDISFALRLDTEPGYDFFSIETNTDCSSPNGWTRCIGGDCDIDNRWDGALDEAIVRSFPTTATSLRVRLRFNSDNGYSDQDGEFDGDGAVHIDNLVVEGVALEDFEGEVPGSTASNDWVSCNPPGFGSSYMSLFPGGTLLQQDVCARNLSCVWAAIAGSTQMYACGGFPLQRAVPRGNARGQYLDTAIWSPAFPLTGTGSVINLQFAVYRDMPLDALVFYVWHVRSYSDASCKGLWKNRRFVYFGAQKQWHTEVQPVGDLIVPSATHMEVALEILDNCKVWCGVIGSGQCHSHAPLLDNVRVYRVDVVGPTWIAQAMHMFQDTFPLDGTTTGIARADMAFSITAANSPAIQQGDSTVIICRDPVTAIPANPSGLADDPTLGGKQIYLYVHCSDAAKSGAMLTDTPSLFPFKDTVVADGRTWTRIRCHIDGNPANSRFKVDLNDELFAGGDIVEFFFGATNTNSETSYCSGSSLNYVQSDRDEAAATASEFSVLPYSPPHPHYGGILYVDGAEGSTAQQYWDAAFDYFGFLPHVDRFDVRAPTSGVSNRPGSYVKNVYQQLYIPYRSILWDGAAYTNVLGDGPGGAGLDKSDDYGMLNSFLAELADNYCIPNYYCGGGVYLSGDDIAQDIASSAVASAVTFKTSYIPFTLTTGNHRPAYGISPTVIGLTGRFAGDDFVVRGGCPLLNDFDVMTPSGSTAMLMSYGAPAANNGAVLAKETGAASVVLSGFSFIYLGDEGGDGPADRIHHLSDVFNQIRGAPLFSGASPVGVTRLEQNYPNPFNPATTIAFSLARPSRVRIDVFTVAGTRVRTLVDESRTAGTYTDVRWDGTDAFGVPVASGVYFYKLAAGDFSQTRKMVLLK